ncbi:acetylserotonin O-methyltransferase-like [Oncorhynchus mykiss]|uniref:acetylserotonin O-methyltransferase-like n=1 Tax=Oncorhynchus mykiss TaxID=8022 RepID=UPI001878A4A1|nr:acetylserotonin O-methyltransferase-like [Oncorhynchus mykiss]
MEGFLVSKTLFTVCEMGLFDLLASSRRPLSLEEVVQVIRASLSGTEKLYLTRSIHYSSKTIYLCWHYLIDAVREGSNQYEKAFGVKVDDLFEAMYRHCLGCIGYRDNTITWFTLSGAKAVYSCDYNTLILYYPSLHLSLSLGCSGALAKKCVDVPRMQLTIFEIQRTLCYRRQPDDQLPISSTKRESQSMTSDKAMGGARNKFYPKLSLPLTDSIVCIVDFFKDELLEADLYILARILHDWTDTQHRTTEKSTGPANQLYTPSSIPLSLLQSFSLMRKIRCDLTLLTLPHPPSSPWVTVSTKASCQTSPQIHTYTHTHTHTHTHARMHTRTQSLAFESSAVAISLLHNTNTLTHLQVHNTHTHTHTFCITMKILFNLQLNLLLETNSKQQSGYDNCHD